MTGSVSRRTARRRAFGILALSISAAVGVILTGLVGLLSSAGLIMAGPVGTPGVAIDAGPPPPHDPMKPTVAVLLGETRTEATDFLAPYSMFAASHAYNVYAVAASGGARTLAGGVDVLPQLTFADLGARVPAGPDVIVVPAITEIASPGNAPILEWLRQQHEGATLFSWCLGAEVLAASGLIDGRPVTTHWGDIDGLERAYPALDWRRGVRYVDDGDVVSTGGITSGVDATLHFLATRHGRAIADRVAEGMHYRESPYLDDPRVTQYTSEPVDAAVYLHLAFGWPKPPAAVWLYDGIGEVDLAAVVEVFGVTSAYALTTVGEGPVVTSEQGLQLVPRRQPDDLAAMDRVFVPGGVDAAAAAGLVLTRSFSGRQVTVLDDPSYAFATALEELAASQDVAIATQAARQLEVRSALRLVGPAWPGRVIVVAIMAALAGALALWSGVTVGRLVRDRARRPGLGPRGSETPDRRVARETP